MKQKYRILIVGDIMMHNEQLDDFIKLKDSNLQTYEICQKLFSTELIDLLFASDTVLGNLETLCDSNTIYRGFPNFNAPPQFLEILKYMNFTDLVVTNNHSKDYTYNAWYNTVNNVIGAGIKPHGYMRNQFDSLKNIENLYVVAGSDRFNKQFDDLDDESLKSKTFQPTNEEDFQTFFRLKSINKPNHQDVNYIAYCHVGEEYNTGLSADQLEILDYLQLTNNSKNKATIFSHSHVIGKAFQRTDFSSKFENGMGNFTSWQENLERQLGSIIEYEYDELTEKLNFVKQHIVETLRNEEGFKTFLLQ